MDLRPSAPPLAPVDAAAVRETAARVTDAATALGADPPAVARVGYGPEPGTVVARARLASRRDDGLDALHRLRVLLEREGWQVAPPGDGHTGLSGRRDDLNVRASYVAESGAFMLDLFSDPLQVGTDLARELGRG